MRVRKIYNYHQIVSIAIIATTLFIQYSCSEEIKIEKPNTRIQNTNNKHNKQIHNKHSQKRQTNLLKGPLKVSIKDYFPEVNVGSIGKNVIYHEAGSYELAKNCFDNILNHSHVGLERHGLMSIGDDVDKIFEDIETLEYYCEIVLKT